jgi:hypothetical protein
MSHSNKRKELLALSREKLIELLPKLKEHKFEEILLNEINHGVELENKLGYKNELPDSKVLAELNRIKSYLSKATASLEYLAKNNKRADHRCDYFYNKANDEDMSMIELCLTNYDEDSASKSGYSITLVKMTNGLDSYIEHIKTSQGRDKNFNYAHLIISIIKVFQRDGFPYKVSVSSESCLIKLINHLLKIDSRHLVKNSIEYQHELCDGE